MGIEHANPMALYGVNRRQCPHLPQPLRRAEWQIEPGRIETIDDIQVVIAGKDEHAFGEGGVQRYRVEEFRPFGGTAGVGHVAANENKIERAIVMDRLDAVHDARNAIVAAWAGAAALNPKSVVLADHMNVGE